ncbi:MAG: hypothetical protein O6650_05060 [Actinobacteria bacterium]|nr:hypothetical protein [Actinomycetota bacterium]
MLRLSAVTLTLFVLGLVASPVVAQRQVNPVDLIMDAFSTPVGPELTAQFLEQPIAGKSTVSDPVGDFFHSSGGTPGFTPDHLDIVRIWILNFDATPIDLFAPTDQSHFWAPTGPFHVEPPNYEPFHTFTGDEVHDGNQYENGTMLFEFTLVATPPVEVKGKCEYVVWVNDLSRGPTFVNDPAFPDDPARGTNIAFGLIINPGGQGLPSTFALELDSENGAFTPNSETDVRSFITPNFVGLTVPRNQIGELAGVNFYSFCVEEGFSETAAESGADESGLIEVTFEDLGTLVIEEQVVATTTTTTTTTTEVAVAEESAPVTTTPEPGQGGVGGFPWWLVLLGGLGLAMLGYWLFAMRGDPCKKPLENWQAAQKAGDDAQKAADAAIDGCEEADLDLEDLEDERKRACKAWPPACWTTEDGGWIEDGRGNRITARDVHMRKMALGEIWGDYRAGRISATQVEAKWQEMDSAEFRNEMAENDEVFKDLLHDIDADIEAAEQARDEACDKAAEAQEKADEAVAAAEAAKKAYEECVAAEVAIAGTAGGTEDQPGDAGSIPGGPGEVSDPCDDVDPKRRYEPAGDADRIRVNVDFSIIIDRYEDSERKVATGQQLVMNLHDLARDLDFAGDMLSARSAGLHIDGSATGYAQGKYVATAAGVVTGGIEATMAATDLVAEVATTPLPAEGELMEKTAQLGALVVDRVTEWMSDYQNFTVRRSFYYQFITATPYNIMECRPGQGWVCAEKVWEFDIGRLQVLKGKDRWLTVSSPVRRAHFEREVHRLSQSAANMVERDAGNLVQQRARHEPGPCQ